MTQLSLLPVMCNRIRPAPVTAAADFIGVDDKSTHHWLCKGQDKHPWLPATEWLCAHLAMACGLPTPPVAVVEIAGFPGQSFFGSQWQSGGLEFLQVMDQQVSNPGIFARTHAVDLFVHNTDRHRGNYLYLDMAGEIVARIIDFSHALLVIGWPLPTLPLEPGCNTLRDWPIVLKHCAAGTYLRPLDIIERIARLDNTWICRPIETMPPQWLTDDLVLKLTCWWIGEGRHNRLRAAKSALP